MGKFLTDKQEEYIKRYGWQPMDGETGLRFFGSDFGEGWIGNVVDLLGIDHTEDWKHADGMDFLVIAYKPTNQQGLLGLCSDIGEEE